jgi:hypothetical protein
MPWSEEVSYSIRLGSNRRSTSKLGMQASESLGPWQFQQTGW